MSQIIELIRKKRDGERLSEEDIYYFIKTVTNGEMEQCQLGAMLMAIFLKGMLTEEISILTRTMMKSGTSFQWPSEWNGYIVDKHSTGGVGDKVSLILTPALAACGLKVPMITGRGLGFTGGTLDKMEAIPGFQANCDKKWVTECINTAGCCIAGQTEDIVPADRVMYACRGVTSTVDCIPLIAGSILSKKAVEGLSALVLDIKVGRAAFMTDIGKAKDLAETLVSTAKQLGIKTTAVLSTMDWPIGKYIGNALEVAESVYGLQGKIEDDLKELVLVLGGHLLQMTGKAATLEEGSTLLWSKVTDGSALRSFQKLLQCQGVTEEIAVKLCQPSADVWAVLPKAKFQEDICYEGEEGYIQDINARILADVCLDLGTGRVKQQDLVSYSAGLQLSLQVGSLIKQGTPWITVHNEYPLTDKLISKINAALIVGKEQVPNNKLIRVISTIQ